MAACLPACLLACLPADGEPAIQPVRVLQAEIASSICMSCINEMSCCFGVMVRYTLVFVIHTIYIRWDIVAKQVLVSLWLVWVTLWLGLVPSSRYYVSLILAGPCLLHHIWRATACIDLFACYKLSISIILFFSCRRIWYCLVIIIVCSFSLLSFLLVVASCLLRYYRASNIEYQWAKNTNIYTYMTTNIIIIIIIIYIYIYIHVVS